MEQVGQNEGTRNEMASRPISVYCHCKQSILRKYMMIESRKKAIGRSEHGGGVNFLLSAYLHWMDARIINVLHHCNWQCNLDIKSSL